MDEQAWQRFGERMYTARRRLHLSSQDLAKQVGTGRTTISRLENHKKPQVTFDVVVRIAEVLGISLDYLAGRNDDEMVMRRTETITQRPRSRKAAPVG